MAMNFSDPTGALQRYQQALGSGRQSYDQALAQQLAAMEQPVDRRGALMRMAQGFLSPTKTGGFAENLGLAVGNYADANDKTREQEMDRAMKLAQIQAARAKLQMEGAGQDFDLFSKGYDLTQKHNDAQNLGAFYRSVGNDPSLGIVADAAQRGEVALPGGGASIPDPTGFGNPPIPMSDEFNQRMREGAGERRQMREMRRLQGAEADLPVRENIVPPTPAGPMPDIGALPGGTMEAFASNPDIMQPPQPLDIPAAQQSMFSPQMAVTPQQMQQFMPQQAPAQQAQPPAQPAVPRSILGMERPQGPVAQRAWDVLNALHSDSPELGNLKEHQKAAIHKEAMDILEKTPEFKRATSERQGRINALKAQGYSDRDATDLVEGVIAVQVDPDTGVPYRVNQITGAAERMTVRSPQRDERELPRPAQSLFERVPTATGVGRSIQSFSTDTLGQIPLVGSLFQSPDVVAARQGFSIAQKALVRALQDNPKYAEGERKAIANEINIEPGAFRSAEGLTARLTEIKSALERRLEIAERYATNYDLPRDFRQAAAQTAESVRMFLSELGDPPDAQPSGDRRPLPASGDASPPPGNYRYNPRTGKMEPE
jgi:hypothetical protein